ncbi:hypothetical protein [Thalassomonas haliotis]|uniref:Lipoprotein n=1 Tax=Thalassomonas haliotis TaxID=485448 RepID=A0ABY7VHV7_9GAMM|nr:hypothetical protein [Thalassomonas haliotis]WDE12611.1 hypothetical protein H3N35_03790 [Thalassomonas haliotis]
MLSACGGSSGSNNSDEGSSPTPTPPPASFPSQVAAPGAKVVNDNGSLILAESGLSLYTFDNDSLDTSNCDGTPEDTDTCAGQWPPLLAADGATATEKMTIITRADDTRQWAYQGQALYHWHQDSAEGDIGGDGINNVWHLARPMPLKTAEISGISSYVGNQTIASVTESSDILTAMRTDKDGLTLYTFDNDPLDDSACSGNCINVWPPLLADAGAMAMPPLTVITAGNGNMQWAYKGKPLYFFASDSAAGDINGDNVNNLWHIASQTPVIQRTTDNGRYLSATGRVNVLTPVGDSTSEFEVTAMDKDGFNLYTFDNDSNEVSNCAGPCLVNWPAFIANDEDVAIASYSIFERSDGARQWAYKGKPLYFFINDTARGDINGAEINDVWHLIEPGITTNFAQEENDLGSVVTVAGEVHVMLRDADSNEFVDALADKSGFALYTFDNDTAGVSNCFDACLDAWPPLLADDSDQASAPFSIMTRSDNGMKQWALNDMPLYFFTPDTTADDVNGENANGVWHIARPAPLKADDHETEGMLFAAHGNVLDSQGKTSAELTGLTLYTFDSDVQNSGESECFDNCAVTWPPLYASAEDQAYGDYTIISRSENNTTTFQWVYKGLPLYFFVGDSQVGDTNGDYPTWTIARP